jgi:hypothetical protein
MEKIKKIVKEAPIELEPGSLPIDPKLKTAIEKGETPHSQSQFIKKVEGGKQFLEKASEKRVKELTDKISNYTGGALPNNPAILGQMMYSIYMEIKAFENSGNNKEILKKMAYDLVMDEIVADKYKPYLKFKGDIVNMGQIDTSDVKRLEKDIEDNIKKQMGDEDEEEEDNNLGSPESKGNDENDEEFNFEVAKRRFINALVQGAAKKGHYLFEYVRRQLERMQPGITNKYGAVMALNDYQYWVMSPQMAQQMATGGNANGGKVKWRMENDKESEESAKKENTDPSDYQKKLVVEAEAIMFPILVHELMKGYYGMLQSYYKPATPGMAQKVKAKTDVIDNEMWDIIVGSLIWDRYLSSLPDDILIDNEKEIQSDIFVEFTKLPKEKFIKINNLLHSYDENDRNRAMKIMQQIADYVIEKIKEQSLRDILGDDSEDEENMSI